MSELYGSNYPVDAPFSEKLVCDIAWKYSNYVPGALEMIHQIQAMAKKLDEMLGPATDIHLIIHAPPPLYARYQLENMHDNSSLVKNAFSCDVCRFCAS